MFIFCNSRYRGIKYVYQQRHCSHWHNVVQLKNYQSTKLCVEYSNWILSLFKKRYLFLRVGRISNLSLRYFISATSNDRFRTMSVNIRQASLSVSLWFLLLMVDRPLFNSLVEYGNFWGIFILRLACVMRTDIVRNRS